jgi:O-antigen/teichoic acid export membrane protein
MNHLIEEEASDIKNIFDKFKRKDFSGTTGQAMKNSSYQLAQNLIFKFGSLFFTVIIARMLLPERMGLYSLALSTIVLFAVFSDLGISSTLMTYCSRMLGRGKEEKSKAYYDKLLKWKLKIIFITSIVLLASSFFIANYYYNKPIFYALLVGALYLPIVSLVGFIEQAFKTTENFKTPVIKEIIFQLTRFTIVPLAIFIFLKSEVSNQSIIVITLLAIILSYTISLIFLALSINKIKFLQVKSENLNESEIKDLKKFIIPLSATAMAGMFFGYIDILMLGHFISTEFIAYYAAAFSLVGGATAIIGFMAAAMMPIFAKKSGQALELIFKKTRNLTILISIFSGIFTYFVSYYVVRIVYGTAYLSAVPILKWFSIIVFLVPIIAIYVGYFTTQKKTKELAWLILGAAILNIVFNWFGISYGLEVAGEMGAVFGAVGATILSRGVYLGGLVVWRKI